MKRLFFILLLVINDIGIKIIINEKYFDLRFDIMGPFLGFAPRINNSNLSIYNSFFDLQIPYKIIFLLNIFILFVFLLFFILLNKETKGNRKAILLTNIFVIFIESGTICSLIDKIWLRGSLDYIKITHWIIDLKDIYIFLGVVSLFFTLIVIKVNELKRNKTN